jgi:hypothetical protein
MTKRGRISLLPTIALSAGAFRKMKVAAKLVGEMISYFTQT